MKMIRVANSVFIKKEDLSNRLKSISIEDITWEELKSNDCNVEYVGDVEYTRLFFDIDYKYEDKEKCGIDAMENDKNYYLDKILPILEKNSRIYDFVYTNGSYHNDNSYKISFHIIYDYMLIKKQKFTVKDEKVINFVKLRLFNGLDESILKEMVESLDDGVYANKSWFRLPYGKMPNKAIHFPQVNTNPYQYALTWWRSYEDNTEVFKNSEPSEPSKPSEAKNEQNVQEDYKSNMIEMLDMVKKERFQNRDKWIELFFLIKGRNLPKELFIRYSKESGYKNFNEDECNSLWYKTDADERYGFPHIHKWLEEDGVDWKNQFCKKKQNMISELLKSFYEAGTLTDLAVSEIFYKNYKDSLYYTQQGWIHYNNYRGWEIGTDDDIIHPLMKLIGEKFISFSNKMKPTEKDDEKEFPKKVKAIKKEGVRLCSASVCQKIIKTSKTLFKNDEIINEFDNKPYWFCFKNMKAIDLKTKEIIDIKKEDKITKNCGYSLPERKEQNIEEATKFIKSIQGEDNFISYMSCISTLLCGNPSLNQLVYIHTGVGGNGKSVVFKALRYTLGNYHGLLPIDNLTKNSSGKDSADSSLVSLNGCRCAQSNEPEDEKDTTLKVARVKEYSGEQFIKCRDLNKSAFQMRITFNLNLLCNEKPKLSKSDEAIERRIRCIPYPYKFVDNPNPNNPLQKKKDYDLEDHITTNEAFRNGLLYLLIDHWYINKGKYIMNESQKNETSEYIKSNNPLSEFLDDYSPSDKLMNIKDLYQQYKNSNYDSNITSHQFVKFIKQLDFEVKEDKSNGHKVHIEKKLIVKKNFDEEKDN
jgi:P4 family phage/plasmid primase-like protien